MERDERRGDGKTSRDPGGDLRGRRPGTGTLPVFFAAAAGVWLGMGLEDRILPALMPLVLAAAASRLVSPSADAVSRAFRISRKTGGALWAVLLCGLTLWLTGLLGGRLAAELTRAVSALPGWIASLTEAAEGVLGRLRERFRLDWPVFAAGEGGGGAGMLSGLLIRAATSLAERAAAFFGRTVQGVPGGMLSLAAGIAAFVWLTADPGGAWSSVLRLIPRSMSGMREAAERGAARIRRAEDVMGRYLRAYLALTGVTFCVLLAGLWIMRVDGALSASFLIALVDILPVLGCGTVLVPWAVGAFLAGESGRGLGLLLLWAAVWVIRQILEPRLVGKAAGIHPFLALAVSYLGLRLFGGAGILGAALLFCLLSAEADGEVRNPARSGEEKPSETLPDAKEKRPG